MNCIICLEKLRNLSCGHIFCYECITYLKRTVCLICCKFFQLGNYSPNYIVRNFVEKKIKLY